MRTPTVDYRNLRPSNICSPEYRHLLLLLSWPGYFILYYLTEKLIPAETCYPIYCTLDDLVPFCEWFVIPYVSWYFLIAGSVIYFLLYNVQSFRNMQTYIIITQLIATAVYILFPNRQDLRPPVLERDNILIQILNLIYTLDTNTGVCPSLHVAYSLGIASTWLREKHVSRVWRVFVAVWAALICVSVAFVKQHSVLDILVAIPMGLFAEWFVFYRNEQTPN